MALSLIANIIAFVVLLFSGVYEIFLGKIFFDKRVTAGKTEIQAFLIGQKYRGYISFVVLLMMSTSMMLTIASNWKESEMPGKDTSKIERKIDDVAFRLKRVEDFIWPPTPGGDKPIDPTGGPSGPPKGPASLGEVMERLESVERKVSTQETNNEEQKKVWRELSELRIEIEANKKTLEIIEKLKQQPAN